jgi:hypothetical protein
LRDYVIQVLEKHQRYELAKILEETNSKFDEIGPIVNQLSILKEGICTLRVFSDTKFKAKLNENYLKNIKDAWNKLNLDVTKHIREAFFKDDETGPKELNKRRMLEDRNNKLLLSLIEDELKKLFSKDVLTNYPKILKHLNSAKPLSAYRPLEQHEDLITNILEEQTVSIDDSIYQKALEQPQHTMMRNLIFKNLGDKS